MDKNTINSEVTELSRHRRRLSRAVGPPRAGEAEGRDLRGADNAAARLGGAMQRKKAKS